MVTLVLFNTVLDHLPVRPDFPKQLGIVVLANITQTGVNTAFVVGLISAAH